MNWSSEIAGMPCLSHGAMVNGVLREQRLVSMQIYSYARATSALKSGRNKQASPLISVVK